MLWKQAHFQAARLKLLSSETYSHSLIFFKTLISYHTRAREIVSFAGSGPIFETENRLISRQEAEKSVHKTQDFDIIIRCYLS